MDELEEAIEGNQIHDKEKFTKAANDLLDAVAVFWNGIDGRARGGDRGKPNPRQGEVHQGRERPPRCGGGLLERNRWTSSRRRSRETKSTTRRSSPRPRTTSSMRWRSSGTESMDELEEAIEGNQIHDKEKF